MFVLVHFICLLLVGHAAYVWQKERKDEGEMGEPLRLAHPADSVILQNASTKIAASLQSDQASPDILADILHVETTRPDRAPEMAFSHSGSCQIYHLGLRLFCCKGVSVPLRIFPRSLNT